jgi:hypothetical protein
LKLILAIQIQLLETPSVLNTVIYLDHSITDPFD